MPLCNFKANRGNKICVLYSGVPSATLITVEPIVYGLLIVIERMRRYAFWMAKASPEAAKGSKKIGSHPMADKYVRVDKINNREVLISQPHKLLKPRLSSTNSQIGKY